MSERSDKAYEHRSKVVGTSDQPNAETEHRDVASGGGEDRNEIRSGEAGTADGYGPRTHQDTKFTEKEGPRSR